MAAVFRPRSVFRLGFILQGEAEVPLSQSWQDNVHAVHGLIGEQLI